MKLQKIWVTMLVWALAALAVAQSVASQADRFVYYARVDYVLSTGYTTSILLESNQLVEISAPPPPPGYDLAYIRVEFPDGMPKGVIPVKFDRSEVRDESVTALISFSGSIKLAASEGNLSSEIRVTVSYVKTTWVELKEGDITLRVEEPPPPFTKNELVVRFTIENHAPFAVSDVKAPSGETLLNNEPAPDALRVDYKHVELNFKYLELGDYAVTVKRDESYVLPSAFIVVEPPFKEDVIAPGSSKRFGIGQMRNWRGIGAVVIVYSIAPLTGRGSGGVDVVGELVDFAYYRDEIVTIRAASYLIPNINLRVYIKAYIVYGSWFEVRNNMRSAVNIMYTTIFIREAGEWQANGVSITVRDSDIKDAMAAYLVVQVPSYGNIVGIRTPSGAELGSTQEGLLPWGNEYRDVRVFLNEAYIQVKAFNSIETGTYFFKIDWKPITFKLIDDGGEAVIGATVAISGPVNATAVSDDSGTATLKLFRPGAYTVSVNFKGIPVANLYLGTIAGSVITVKCNVFRVSWLVVDAWDKALGGAEIVVKNGDTLIARAVTGENGATPVLQIPGGQFVVQANYKRISSTSVEQISSSGVRKLRVNVLFELPFFGGIPVTTLEAALMGVAAGGGTIGFGILKRMRSSTVEELSVEE
ncbi:MAG: carboxypeptidase-like regulatory domain-containing protein [Thermofilaceae archaeon]